MKFVVSLLLEWLVFLTRLNLQCSWVKRTVLLSLFAALETRAAFTEKRSRGQNKGWNLERENSSISLVFNTWELYFHLPHLKRKRLAKYTSGETITQSPAVISCGFCIFPKKISDSFSVWTDLEPKYVVTYIIYIFVLILFSLKN